MNINEVICILIVVGKVERYITGRHTAISTTRPSLIYRSAHKNEVQHDASTKARNMWWRIIETTLPRAAITLD